MTETHTSSYLKRTNWPIFPTTSRAENTHGTAATQILTGPTASATSENRVLLLFLERKCSQAPQLQIFVPQSSHFAYLKIINMQELINDRFAFSLYFFF